MSKCYLFASRGRNREKPSDRRPGIKLEQRAEINYLGCSNTITSVEKDNYLLEIGDSLKLRIRKLTPKECGKLMGLKSDDDDKMTNVQVSDTQKYKQYGNGIVTNCVQLIFEHLYKAQYDNTYKCTDENFQNPQLV